MKKSVQKQVPLGAPKNEIVVYQPNETIRLEVRVQEETVWLEQSQMAQLFGCTIRNVRMHLANIYASGELMEDATRKDFFLVRTEGSRKVSRNVACYNLDAIISVGYRVNSVLGVQFRIWATSVLKTYLLQGMAFRTTLCNLEDKMDRRFTAYDAELASVKKKVDFFIRTNIPPLQGIFYDGQVFDARAFATRLTLCAQKTIVLIDNWIDVSTLEILAKKSRDVALEIITSARGNKLTASDVDSFRTQYGDFSLRTSENFHDRFLIIDGTELYLVGASLKDLGKKCFAFTKLDPGEIPGLLSRIRTLGRP